ncbi:C1 family peptidase [candidate division KSB1 bacterium]
MKKYLIISGLIVMFLVSSCSTGKMTQTDQEIIASIKAIEKELQNVKKEVTSAKKQDEPDPREKIYRSIKNRPRNMDIKLKHSPPISQGGTGTCWCFSTTAFLESELVRRGKGYWDLSEMFTVYYEYIEKSTRFIETKGEQRFGEGGLSHDVIHVMRKYGAVRETDYDGRMDKNITHNHRALFNEIMQVINGAKEYNVWNKEEILGKIRTVLNKHLGEPPKSINVNGKDVNPVEFVNNVLEIPFDDYIEITSYSYMPFFKQGKLKIADNWMQNDKYYNVPLNDFMEQFKYSIENGYTNAIDYDVSELGNLNNFGYYVVPEEETQPEDVNQETREKMYESGKTRDEHLVQIMGYKGGKDYDWYLVRDSAGAFRSPYRGYAFMRDDYVKLKVLAYMIHKDALMDKIKSRF